METFRFLMVSSFYPPYHLGGDAVHVKHLSEALARQGHEVHVEYAPGAYRVKRPLRPPPASDRSDLVHLHPIHERGGYSVPASAYVRGVSRTATRVHERLTSEIVPDVVHLHNISLLGLGVQWAPMGIPILYTAHDYWFRCPRSDLLKFGAVPCDRPACTSCMLRSHRIPALWRGADLGRRLDRVACVIAPSRFMARLASESFRCEVVHIPNFVPDRNPGGGVGKPGSYYLYAGVFELHKGLGRLVQAAERYRGPMRFVLVGRGSLTSTLEHQALKPGSRIEVRPWAEPSELDTLYRGAAAFLMPSLCLENSPLAAIEALSWGTPLLATTRGGVAELLWEGAAGFSFDPSPEALLDALRAFESVSRPESLRRGARLAYEQHHRPEAYVARYLSVVRRLGTFESTPLALATDGASDVTAVRGLEA